MKMENNDTIYSPIKAKVREYMNALADHMACGGCKSFEEYREAVGKVDALAQVERDILDLEERFIND
jgi:hypothetical protein|tara:strand:+ start:1845 stop:2045 length:201 start_codon:yes stop_codon:yes gene_type:complete